MGGSATRVCPDSNPILRSLAPGKVTASWCHRRGRLVARPWLIECVGFPFFEYANCSDGLDRREWVNRIDWAIKIGTATTACPSGS